MSVDLPEPGFPCIRSMLWFRLSIHFLYSYVSKSQLQVLATGRWSYVLNWLYLLFISLNASERRRTVLKKRLVNCQGK
jgi:hypothetical protein